MPLQLPYFPFFTQNKKAVIEFASSSEHELVDAMFFDPHLEVLKA